MVQDLKLYEEGITKFYASSDNLKTKDSVFYNPMMRISRDLTLLVLAFLRKMRGEKKISFLDLMAASGVRSLRVLNELKDDRIKVHINDYSKLCYNIILKNIKLLGSHDDEERVKVYNEEALKFLSNSQYYDFIQIDPFEDINKFLYPAISKVKNGGILALTTTDTASLSGTYPRACVRRYDAVPQNFDFKHEFGLRILIRAIQIEGSKQDRLLKPIITYYYKHHFGAFFQVIKGRERAYEPFKNHEFLLYCTNCLNRKTTRSLFNREICDYCGGRMKFAGKFYTGKLFDEEFLKFTENILPKRNYPLSKETEKVLQTIREEAGINSPYTFNLHLLSQKFKLKLVKMEKLIKLLKSRGFNASRTHFNPLSIRTDAGVKDIVDAMKHSI